MSSELISTERTKKIISLSLPMMGGMASQNVANLIDIYMIGYLGKEALGAVGFASFLYFMTCAIFQGLGTGVQTLVARRIGEKRREEAAYPLMLSLILILFLSFPMSIGLYYVAPMLMDKIQPNSSVRELMLVYFQARVFSIFATATHFCFRGFWNGVQIPKVYLNAILILHSTNITLNFLLIFGGLGIPALGVFGVGLSSSIALYIALISYLYFAVRYAKAFGFHWESFKAVLYESFSGLHKTEYQQLIKLSLPAGLQQFSLLAGFSVFYWIVGHIGTEASAAANVILNINLTGILPLMGFGMATTTLVSKAMGEKHVDMAYQWAWDVAKISVLVILVIAAVIFTFPTQILGIFIKQPEVIAIGITPLRLASIWLLAESVGLIMLHALMGAGATKSTMLVALICQWMIGLPLAYFLGVYCQYGLIGVWIAQGSYRGLQSLCYIYLWMAKKWQKLVI
jgi:MATE family multidrug resistance protein